MTTKISLVSLGCAKNLVDSEVMLSILDRAGYTITDSHEDAQVLLVNTCGFISSAKEESINKILQLAQYKNDDNKLLIVVGCLVQKYKKDLAHNLPEVDIWLGTDQVENIAEIVKNGLAGKKTSIISDNPSYVYQNDISRLQLTPKHTAYLKVAEGCNNNCSYCAIPQMRGRYKSRPIESLILEAKQLALSGVKELNIIAQDTTMYGIDLYGKFELADLLKELLKIKEIQWIRLLYCYPDHFDQQVIELIKQEDRICNYLDLPLQHADDQILHLMNRKSTQFDIVKLLNDLRKNVTDIAIRTTFIVGFPNETKENFDQLVNFTKEYKFNWLGVFTYSQEENTPAAEMDYQIPEDVKESRRNYLMEVQNQITSELNFNYINQELKVLVEGVSEENSSLFYGRTQYQAPDIDGITLFTAKTPPKIGEFVKVRITHLDNYDLIGEMVP